MVNNKTNILEETANYFSATLAEHGSTAEGVGWNGSRSQETRFEQLLHVITKAEKFSINDLGCGYGALLDYMKSRYQNIIYNGYDVSERMIHMASSSHSKSPSTGFFVANEPSCPADYGVASGIFNIRLGRSDSECYECLLSTLDALDRTSRCGFAFNCLTTYSDADKMRNDLYYANPCVVFDVCKRRFSRHVALLHDYDLYDFTVIVRKH